MGPVDISISESTTIKAIQPPKLASDGENWLTYHEQVLNVAIAHGLCCHLMGTVFKPSPIVERAGNFFLETDNKVPLLDKALEKHKTSQYFSFLH